MIEIWNELIQCLNEPRDWSQMTKNCKEIWELVKEKKNEKKSDVLSIKFGVRDQLNRHFASEIYDLKKLEKKLTKDNEPIPDNLKSDILQNIVDLEKNDPNPVFGT
jgi:hypothetical protein